MVAPPTGTSTGGNTNVIGYLHHLHNSMVTSVAEETFGRVTGLHEAWLADIAALEWELGQQDLAAALGMNIAVGNALAEDDNTTTTTTTTTGTSTTMNKKTTHSIQPGTGKYDSYATLLSEHIADSLKFKAEIANGGSFIPLTNRFEEGSKKYYNRNTFMDNRSRLYELLRYVSYGRDKVLVPDINIIATRWYDWSAVSVDKKGPNILGAKTLEIESAFGYKHPSDRMIRQWACGGLFYLQDIYKVDKGITGPKAQPNPVSVDDFKFEDLYTDLRCGNYVNAITAAENFCNLWEGQDNKVVRNRTSTKYHLCKAITIYGAYFYEGVTMDIVNGDGENQAATEGVVDVIQHSKEIVSCLEDCANIYEKLSNPADYTIKAQNDPDYPYQLELLALVAGPYSTGVNDNLPNIIPPVVFNKGSDTDLAWYRDVAWHSLWLAASTDIASITANSLKKIGKQGNVYSLFKFAKDIIATFDNPLLNNQVGGSSFTASNIATPVKKKNALDTNPYPITELFILAGLPEYGIAYLASHPSSDAAYNKHLHDALHLGLALTEQGLLRIFPFNLATTASLSKKLPLTIQGVPLDSLPHDISRFCYGLELSNNNNINDKKNILPNNMDSNDLPIYTLDLTYICVTYCSRILQDYSSTCINYYSLLPDQFSRMRTMAMVLSTASIEFIKGLRNNSPGMAFIKNSRKDEISDCIQNGAELARQKGDVDKAVALYRYILDTNTGEDNIINEILPLALELCTDELSGLAPIRFDYVLHNLGTADSHTLQKREDLYTELGNLLKNYNNIMMDKQQQQILKRYHQAATYAERVRELCKFFDYVYDNNWSKALEILMDTAGIVPQKFNENIVDQWRFCYEGTYADPVPKYLQAIYPSILRAAAYTYRHRYDELKDLYDHRMPLDKTKNNKDVRTTDLQNLRQHIRNLCSGHTKLMRDHISPEVFADIGEIEASFE